LQSLEKTVQRQSARIQELERSATKEFEVVHYNVLSDQAGTNMQPWFCYGANLTPSERRELHRRFYASGDQNKRLHNKGWPTWAVGVLSPERIAAVEEYDQRIFGWERRRERLWQQCVTASRALRRGAVRHSERCVARARRARRVASHQVGCRVRSPDIVTLAECDHFASFWQRRFHQAGYEATWRKRPRSSSRDGCAIAWRASTFECVATSGFDFGSKLGSDRPDRTCCFALLRWRRDPSVRLLVATTHLERNPDSEVAQMARGFQYGTIFRELLAFAGAHDAEEVR
jgi:mRNA deadenylase 3'-5' endonuclease subunit Ccr4